MNKRKLIRFVFRPLFWIFSLFLFLELIPYLNTQIYEFPETKPFSGDQWYNPYQELDGNQKPLKANFHAHSHAWGGISNGDETVEELRQAYLDMGYDIPGISNYLQNTYVEDGSDLIDFPIYEHGYNMLKSHRLVFGAKQEKYFDFPLFHSTSHKQYLLNYLNGDAKAIAIAHPVIRSGHTPNDMKKLVGYDFIEVLNCSGYSFTEWDAALSAGKLSWILGNDDTHGIHREPTFIKWNRIYAEGSSQDEVLEAMKAGKMYAVHAAEDGCEPEMRFCKMSGDTLKVGFRQNQVSIVFIGKDGEELGIAYNNDSAQFVIPKDAPYVRVFAFNPDCFVFLNPVLRWDGEKLPLASGMKAKVKPLESGLVKMLVFAILMLVSFAFFLINGWFKWEIKR